jgi:hypothetical protein
MSDPESKTEQNLADQSHRLDEIGEKSANRQSAGVASRSERSSR